MNSFAIKSLLESENFSLRWDCSTKLLNTVGCILNNENLFSMVKSWVYAIQDFSDIIFLFGLFT